MNYNDIRKRVRRSALWAAYGDALGFISELVDRQTVKARVGSETIDRPVAWRKKVGGKFGKEIEIFQGTYSDDTQLRLATSRAIRSDCFFDVDAFAKIELPVWLGYALGGGRSSKIAAKNLRKSSATWFSNFFEEEGISYFAAGGNGAAMRIQPHVWKGVASGSLDRMIADVFRNSIVTHGHERGIFGAIFHALVLRRAILDRKAPGPEEWTEIISDIPRYLRVVSSDRSVADVWRPVWEQRKGDDWEQIFKNTASEMEGSINMLFSVFERDENIEFSQILDVLGCKKRENRGSGTLTALAAAALAWIGEGREVAEVLSIAANSLGSDTDTIATMTGAIIGANSESEPKQVLDQQYISEEAERLANGTSKSGERNFEYPDISKWRPPKSQSAILGQYQDKVCVKGLGPGTWIGPEPETLPEKENNKFRWLRLKLGQTLLVREHDTYRSIREEDFGQYMKTQSEKKGLVGASEQEALSLEGVQRGKVSQPEHPVSKADQRPARQGQRESSIDELSDRVIEANFDARLIGDHILQLSNRENGIELVNSYSAIIAKAWIARQKRRH